MFVNNKYQMWYASIIAQAQDRPLKESTYYERHHILPKSLGGPDAKWNMVKLTGKEHFIVHKLLTKFTQGPAYHKMVHAQWRMIGSKDKRDRHKVSASEYARIKELNSQSMSVSRKGKAVPALLEASARRKGKPAHNKGKPMPRASIEQMVQTRMANNAGKPVGLKMRLTEEQRAKRIERLATHRRKGGDNPKFRTVLYNTQTHERIETTHMKKMLKSLGVNDRQFYSGNSAWIILEKWSLKTGERLI